MASLQIFSYQLFLGKPSHLSRSRRHHHQFQQVCFNSNAITNEEETDHPHGKFDRRNLLLGMGAGMYGAANLDSAAIATPISGPDFNKCSRGVDDNTNKPLDVNCCPPVVSAPMDYKLPPVTTKRYRPAAHLVDGQYIAKYERAVALMKDLHEDDPRNFYQQANIHCAYCDLNFEQEGSPGNKLQIHFCWHFFPWHRWYLYFYERILGTLIEDPTFGLPFWNWDNFSPAPYMPDMYRKTNSPLYDPRRNPAHLCALTDLKYSDSSLIIPADKIIASNLTEMYGEMIRNATTLVDFYGRKYVVGTTPSPGMGTVERGSHTAVHNWVGECTKEGLDMGNLYSAGRDSIFFAHHANIDRLWTVWRDRRDCDSLPKDFPTRDWLDASYLFYDENANLVRVYNRDALNQEKMGYIYQKVDNPWSRFRPIANVKKSKVATTVVIERTIFPVKLDKVVRVVVDRPRTKRSKEDKIREEELLVIEGIEVETSEAVRFEVYENDRDDEPRELIDKAEYAGSFAQVPHKNSTTVKSTIRLGLTELLEDLDIEEDDKILVSLVPAAGGKNITIGGLKIVYIDITSDD